MTKAAKLSATKILASTEVEAALARLEGDREAALAEHHRLETTRPAVVLSGTDEDLRAHDEATAKASRDAERAEARRVAMLPELDVARAAEDQARRRAAYQAAQEKLADGRRALTEYQSAAEQLAKIARRVASANFAITGVNRELPDGAEPLELPEPFNGAPPREAEYADQVKRTAIDLRTGREVGGYDPNDLNIGFRERKTGLRIQINPPWSGRPHRSFLMDLRIPSYAEPGKSLF